MKQLLLILAAAAATFGQGRIVGNRTLDGSLNFCADAGSNDTYACSISPAPGELRTNTVYLFKANTANTGAATINFNSLGAKTIKKLAGGVTTDLSDNDIRAGQYVEVVYDGTNMQMLSALGNAAAGSSGLTLVESETASASSSLDFTTCITSSHDDYMIVISNLVISTNDAVVGIQVSTDGGSTWVTTSSYVSARYYYRDGPGSAAEAEATTYIRIFPAISTAAAGHMNATIYLHSPLETSGYKRFNIAGSSTMVANMFGFNGFGHYVSESAINAFRIVVSAGTLTSGKARCYGLAK